MSFQHEQPLVDLPPDALVDIAINTYERLHLVRESRRPLGEPRRNREDPVLSHTEATLRMAGMLESLRYIDRDLERLTLVLLDSQILVEQIEKDRKILKHEQVASDDNIEEDELRVRYAGGLLLLATGIEKPVYTRYKDQGITINPKDDRGRTLNRVIKLRTS